MGKIVNSTFVSLDGVINHRLTLAGVRAFNSGVVLLSYQAN